MSKRVMVALFLVVFASSAIAANITYTYDTAGRVARVDYGNGKGFVYTYDANGNLLRRTSLSAISSVRHRAVRH